VICPGLLAPARDELLEHHAVSMAVNDAKNDGPELLAWRAVTMPLQVTQWSGVLNVAGGRNLHFSAAAAETLGNQHQPAAKHREGAGRGAGIKFRNSRRIRIPLRRSMVILSVVIGNEVPFPLWLISVGEGRGC
jgi:hypothetical protein